MGQQIHQFLALAAADVRECVEGNGLARGQGQYGRQPQWQCKEGGQQELTALSQIEGAASANFSSAHAAAVAAVEPSVPLPLITCSCC